MFDLYISLMGGIINSFLVVLFITLTVGGIIRFGMRLFK